MHRKSVPAMSGGCPYRRASSRQPSALRAARLAARRWRHSRTGGRGRSEAAGRNWPRLHRRRRILVGARCQMVRPARDRAQHAAAEAQARSAACANRRASAMSSVPYPLCRHGPRRHIACIPGERPRPPTRERIIVNGPIKSKGTAATQRQLDCFKAAIGRSGVAVDEAFVPALAPGWLDHFIYNEHYKTDEEFVYALAEAMSDKYPAIVEAGFILQIDDPGIATSWDVIKPEPSLADYRKYVTD